jgi:hypothetical protein
MLYILLDIDGTLLPTYLADKSRAAKHIQLGISESNLPLNFYADIVTEFVKISQLPKVEIIMCSSWDETSLEIAELLGIESWQYLTFISENPKHWYKWDSVVSFCKAHRKDKIILCDDLATRKMMPRRPWNLVKVFKPKPRVGLTLEDMKKIWKYVRKQK